jgi:hypothetical protein
VPSPVAFGKDGLFVPHFTPPDFVAWCNDHNLEPSQAARDAWYHLPSKVIPLASSGDPRGFRYWRRVSNRRTTWWSQCRRKVWRESTTPGPSQR